MRFSIKIIFLLFFCLCFSACSKETTENNEQIITIKSKSVANTLYYSGIVMPLKTIVIPSPADGTVVEMPIQYGEPVKPGQLLFVISSTKFFSDYKAALLAYIKAKSEYNTAKQQLSESKFLHKNLLIPDDEFKNKKSAYYGAQLGLLQAKDALENLLAQSDVKNIDLNKLSITDVDKIIQALRSQASFENLRILSPAQGFVLAQSKSEGDSKKILKGDVIKQGDALAMIGDMSGLSVHIKVNELTVNQLKVGQKVKVTGIAFPDYELEGEVRQVDRQGETMGGGVPSFTTEVVVPKLTPEQQKNIHVGMSAKVEIIISAEPQITVPIAAVSERDGNVYVQCYDDKLKKSHEVAVKTGKTTPENVAILAGLKPGDKILLPNS